MKKYIFALILLLTITPAHAQRVIKYITFYPVPYGSHQNLSVTDKAVISGRDQGETKISGKLAVSSSSANIFDGSLSVNVGGPTIVNVSQQLKSGNTSAYSPFGPAYMSGNTAISNMEGVLLSGNISGAVNTQGNVNIGMESTANLTSCSSAEATWQALRVKGSEECKYYLTCGGSTNNTGCSGAPEDLTCSGCSYLGTCFTSPPSSLTCSAISNSDGMSTSSGGGTRCSGTDYYGWQIVCKCPDRSTVTLYQSNTGGAYSLCNGRNPPQTPRSGTTFIGSMSSSSMCDTQANRNYCSSYALSGSARVPACSGKLTCNGTSGVNYDCAVGLSTSVSFVPTGSSSGNCNCNYNYYYVTCN